MKRTIVVIVLCLSVALNAWLISLYTGSPIAPAPVLADVTAGGEELSVYMGIMQRHTQKLGLALDAGNKDLAAFYYQELSEAAEVIQKKFPGEYDGFQINALLGAMLVSQMGPIKAGLDKGDMAAASSGYDGMITACNSCHLATQHAFLKVSRTKTNPFNQDFSK